MRFREITPTDLALQKQFLLVALWTPDEEPDAPPSVLEIPHIKEFYADWGRAGDLGYFALNEKKEPVGIVQVRYKSCPTLLHNNLPELALAVAAKYRGQGIALKLMQHILSQIDKTTSGIRLGVHPRNHAAICLYRRFGFDTYDVAQSGYPQMVRIRSAKPVESSSELSPKREMSMESHRLKLLPPSMALQPQMRQAIQESQQELGVYLPWVPYALTEEESIEHTQQAMDNFANFEGELRFSIIEKETDTLVGAIGLIIRDKSVPFYEIGYWLRNQSVGRGYVTEAVGLVERYAFEELKARRVEIKAAEGNQKSRAVAERCGYRLEATLRNERRLPSGELSNTVVYAKLNSEYPNGHH